MYDNSFDGLHTALFDLEQRLGYWWHNHRETDPRIADLQHEALQRLGQTRWCLKRIQEIERREGGDNDFEHDRTGSEGLEIEILTEACYYFAHRFLKLTPKVNTPGFPPTKAPKLDLVIIRNWLIEHADNPEYGTAGRHFMYQVEGGPHVKPFADHGEQPKQKGLYRHMTELVDWLRPRIEHLEDPSRV